MWKLWNQKTEVFLSKLYPLISAGRPKGTMPDTKRRAVTASSNAAGAETARQKRLRKLYTRLRRMRILIAEDETLTDAEINEVNSVNKDNEVPRRGWVGEVTEVNGVNKVVKVVEVDKVGVNEVDKLDEIV